MTLADELLRVPVDAIAAFGKSDFYRSEERRVGKECRL